MRDDLRRFPTPSEAFGSHNSGTKSPAYGDLGNIPSLPNQRRHASPSPVQHGYSAASSRSGSMVSQAGPAAQPRSAPSTYSRQQQPLQPQPVHSNPDSQRGYGQQPQVYYQAPASGSYNATQPVRSNYAQPAPIQQHHHQQQQQQPRYYAKPQAHQQPPPPPSSHQYQQPRPRPPVQQQPAPQSAQPPSVQAQRGPTPMPQPPQPPQPAPPRQPRDDLRALFDSVDRNKNGYLTEAELSSALVNGDYSRFDPNTVRVMIKMFDRDNDGALHFQEFGQLWKYLHEWRNLFDRFDRNASEAITVDEFSAALAAFGYKLMPACVQFVFAAGSRVSKNTGVREMSFDMFVKSCINIKSITDTFKKYDDDRDGFITMSFEDFLMEITKLVS